VTDWPVITAESLAKAKRLCHVDELADDRESSKRDALGAHGALGLAPARHCSRPPRMVESSAM
jgi:hypothetical protein